jgi:transcription elongation factor Elf1
MIPQLLSNVGSDAHFPASLDGKHISEIGQYHIQRESEARFLVVRRQDRQRAYVVFPDGLCTCPRGVSRRADCRHAKIVRLFCIYFTCPRCGLHARPDNSIALQGSPDGLLTCRVCGLSCDHPSWLGRTLSEQEADLLSRAIASIREHAPRLLVA